MRIQPDSTVNLYGGVDIDITSGVEIAFKTIANQRAYFASKLVRANTPCTMIKKTGYVRLEVPGTVVKNCNYISFTNPSFDNKTFYGAITDYNYINNECVEISYIIDWWQSYMFEVTYERMGIDRQYLNETDFAKAEANPYDQSIFAFQTNESLPYDKSLEPRSYKYLTYSNSPNPMLTSDGITSDGCYAMTTTQTVDATDAVTNLFANNCYVLIMAPVDYNEIDAAVQEKITKYKNAVTSSKYGRYSAPYDNFFYGNLVNPSVIVDYNTDYKTQSHSFLWSDMPSVCEIWVIPADMEVHVTEGSTIRIYNVMYSLMSDLTRWNCVSQIQGIYSIPRAMVDSLATETVAIVDPYAQETKYSGDYDTDDLITFPTAFQKMRDSSYDKYAPHCQKLYTHPFSYLRVETPSGNAKEFKYEDFYEVTTDNTKMPVFRTMTIFNGVLTPMMIPRKYKEYREYPAGTYTPFSATSVDPQLTCEFNIDERVEIDNIPAIAYMTDSYLTYLSSEYTGSRAAGDKWGRESTVKTLEAFDASKTSQFLSVVRNAIGSSINATATLAGAKNPLQSAEGYYGLSGMIPNFFGTKASMYSQMASMQNTQKADELYNGFSAFMEDTNDAYIDAAVNYSMAHPAYANNVYHPGSTGDPMYTMGNKLIDFRVTHVHLREVVMKKYDEYFKTYGYNYAGMVDIPYICRYTQNESSNDYLPHWEQVNGKNSTYIKTVDAHVTHAMLPVSQAIEGMLNKGVRMLRGEDLYV